MIWTLVHERRQVCSWSGINRPEGLRGGKGGVCVGGGSIEKTNNLGKQVVNNLENMMSKSRFVNLSELIECLINKEGGNAVEEVPAQI